MTSTVTPLQRGARIAVSSVALAGVALGVAAPAAMAERVDLTSPYGYVDDRGITSILGGYDKPAGMQGDSSIAFCIEMGVYFPSSTNRVEKQATTDEYPEIAYIINKWGDNRDNLNQAAVQYLVHRHLDVHDAGFQSAYGIGPGDTSRNNADYQASRQKMLNGVQPRVRDLANTYWAEAEQNASRSYTAAAPRIAVDGMNGTVTGFSVLKDNGSPVAGSTQITVKLTGQAEFADGGGQSKRISIADAQKGIAVKHTTYEGGQFGVSYEVTGLPTNKLVIAEMAPHDGGDGYDGTGRYPEGNPAAGDRKTDRRGAPTQTSVSALAGTIGVTSGAPVRSTFTFPDPDLGTVATDQLDGDKHVQQVGGTVVDTLEFSGLVPGVEYTVEGQLMDKTTGEEVTRASTTFVPETTNGTTTIEFALPDEAQGKTLVAFETILRDGEIVVEHKDIDDEAQTVFVMDFETYMGGDDLDDTGRQFLPQTGGTIVDEVQYSNFKPGAEYTVRGELIDRATGESTGITGTQAFTASETGSGIVEVAFDIPAEHAGKDLVAFQAIYQGDVEIAADRNIDNDFETVYIADLATQARDQADGDQNLVQSGAVVVDTIRYTNLVPGQEYTVTGELMDKGTGEGTGITAEATFTPTERNGEAQVVFPELPAEHAGKTLVAFERVADAEGNIVAVHEDIEDTEQTVYIADVATQARDESDGDQNIVQRGGTVVDTVAYTNLVPGQEYKVSGELMDKGTGEGTGITAEATFTPEEANGTAQVVFEDLPAEVAGKTLVAFETVTQEIETEDEEGNLASSSVVVAEHKDLEDVEQTVYIADIATQATDAADGDKSVAWKDGVVTDTVEYTNLVPGEEYTMSGVLMDKATGEALLDDDGNPVASELVFTPEEANGSVELDFELPDSAEGKTLVAFEELVDAEGTLIAEHKDIEDADQTVYVSQIRTLAFDEADGDKQVAYDGVIIDTVKYENLIPGQEYTIKGELMDKVTGDPILDDVTGLPVVAEAKFTPTEASGETDVRFDLGRVSDRDIVVFETLYNQDGEVQAEHRDLNDLSQTVHTSQYTPPPVPDNPAPMPPNETPVTPVFNDAGAGNAGSSGDAGAGLARTGAEIGGLGVIAAVMAALGFAGYRSRRKMIADSGE